MTTIHSMKPARVSWQIKIGTTLFVLIGTTGDEQELENEKTRLLKKARAAMLAGQDIEHDGTLRWIHDCEVYPAVWDETGNKSLHSRTLRIKNLATGEITNTIEKSIWKKPEA